ncbi:DUF4349 domain-containing protein [Pontiellaceae bacterium B1224]|nr:DUF4349 domain-containing protein [Pontiellaceae bacterium B1224]
MFKLIVPTVLIAMLLSGCHSYNSNKLGAYEDAYYEGVARTAASSDAESEPVKPEQMLIWTGSMTIEVLSISNATVQIISKTKDAEGYLEGSSQNDYGRPSTTLNLRIPSNQLASLLASLEGVGEVTSKRLSSEDVTERYVDMQARLETNKQLRDRLQKLLDRADEVKDVLAIERELTRLQADIDSMTARLKAMKGKVDYASLTIQLNAKEHEKVLGPLGYVWEGATWCVKKLFVWKDASYEQQ